MAQLNREFALWNLGTVRNAFRKAISSDKCAFYSGLADNLKASSTANATEVWRDLRSVNPKTRRKIGTSPVQGILKPDGEPAMSYAEIRQVWHNHFSAVESAEDTTFHALLQSIRESQDKIRGTFDFDHTIVPSLPELEEAFRAAKGNRSSGPDSVPDELFAIYARPLLRIFGPLFYKAILRLDAPLSFAGGLLHELYKGSGVGSLVDNWRSILCSNSVGKRLHKVVRTRLFSVADGWLSGTQVGGRPRCGVDIASHTLKLFLDVLFAHQISGVCFFLDIKAAFYSVLRPLLYETGGDEESFARLVLLLGLPDSCIPPLLDSLRSASVLEQAGASPHLQAMTHSLFNGLWWQVKGHTCPARPARGFCPGTGVADLAFTLVFRLYVSSLQDRLRSKGIGLKLRCPDSDFAPIAGGADVEFLDVTWVDDTVVCAACGSPDNVLPVAARIASLAFSDLRHIGFTPNTKLGKTHIMPVVIGKGAPAVSTDIFTTRKAIITVDDAYGNSYNIHAGLDYKHLGSFKDAKRNKTREHSYRIAEAATASAELFRATRRADVPPDKAWRLAESLCASRLCFDVHTDSTLSEAHLKRLSAAYNGFARRCVNKKLFHVDTRKTADHALAICGALPLELHVLHLRVGYVGRILGNAPPFLLAAIQVLADTKDSFLSRVIDDLAWLHRGRGGAFGLPHPEELSDTFDWIRAQPFRFKQLVKRSRNASSSHFSVTGLAKSWHEDLLRQCDLYAFPGSQGKLQGPVAGDIGDLHYKCWCGSVFQGFQGLVTHAVHRHGYRRQEYAYLNDDGKCFGCLQIYHNKVRLLEHLTKQGDMRCLGRLISNYPPDFQGTGKTKYGKSASGNAVHRVGPPRDIDRLPILKGHGPLLPLRDVVPACGPSGLAYSRCPAPSSSAVATVAPLPVVPIPDSVRFRGVVHFFVLNLCCGHRRPNDVEDIVSRIVFPSNFRVWFVSIDIVSGNSEHNLADPKAFDRIIALLTALSLHGWLIGPPCETWTEVRFQPLPGGKGPRPLRSAAETWGLEGLSQREYLQLSIGNILLKCAATLAVESARCGVSGIVEHPDTPSAADRPSIWRLPIFKRLLKHSGAHQFSFKQGPLGQASPKPTRFHATYLPRLRAYINTFSSEHFKPKPVELGTIEENGLFATTKLKTYPPRLNAANVLGFIDRFARASSAFSSADELDSFLDSAFRAAFERCVEIESDSTISTFLDQSGCPAAVEGHPLHSLAAWPDRDAKIGKDFAF